MFSYYTYRTGLSNTDVQSIQALYGAPQSGSFFNNHSMWTAAPFALDALLQYGSQFTNPTQLPGSLPPLAVMGDITSLQDADYYSYQSVPGNSGFTIDLQTSGISLFDAQVTVYNSFGQVVASAVARPAGRQPQPEHRRLLEWRYTIEVQSGSQDVFGMGGYESADCPQLAAAPAPLRAGLADRRFHPAADRPQSQYRPVAPGCHLHHERPR